MTRDDSLQAKALNIALHLLSQESVVTPDLLNRAIDGATEAIEKMEKGMGADVDRDALRAAVEQNVNVWATHGSSLDDNRDHVVWLQAEWSDIRWRFWDRYYRYMNGRIPINSLRQLDVITEDILGKLESPRRQGAWDRRGMVVGQVQSGKTANYTGLICKAADAGYRLIVVLAGVHNSLRSQTQERIDEGFLGWDTQHGLRPVDGASHRTGVGLGVASPIPAHSYTTSAEDGDFSRKVAQQLTPLIGSDPVVLVVKKHATILKNLIEWTTRDAVVDPDTGRKLVKNQPLLVIDDEADNASVNTKDVERETNDEGNLISESDPTAINRRIRELLNSFEQSAYVAYTATPFANIFIFEDEVHSEYGRDLFPESFIVRIPPPSNYIGAPQVFGLQSSEEDEPTPPLPIVREVSDNDGFISGKSKAARVRGVPESLQRAIHSFLLACAVRQARGQTAVFNSMLIHVTRFVAVQQQILELVEQEVDRIKSRLRYGDGGSGSSLIDELRQLWESDFVGTARSIPPDARGAEVGWGAIQEKLTDAAQRITVRAVNGAAQDALIYKNHEKTGLSVIVIGGDKLSRGLTLEGLTVSYYLRTSKMYDTLLQMGRWFGYRPGYLDVCRLYTTRELIDWYTEITAANEELNREFDAMAAANETPRDYGLRVRSHPEGLLVTARVKMRNARQVDLSFDGTNPQTTSFSYGVADQQRNIALTQEFLESQEKAGRYKDSTGDRSATLLWQFATGEEVAGYLEHFAFSKHAHRINGPLLAQYIRRCNDDGNLVEWSIAMPSGKKGGDTGPWKVAGREVTLVERKARTQRPENRSFSIQSVISPTDELLDLDHDQRQRALDDTLNRYATGQLKRKNQKAPTDPDGTGARVVRSPRRGLLILYPVDTALSNEPAPPDAFDNSVPIIGVALSFPRTENRRTVRWTVNNVYWHQVVSEPDE